jgi:hypothetical protein
MIKIDQEAWNRKPHCCKFEDSCGVEGECNTYEDKLDLIVDDGCECQSIYVPFCQFCGYKNEE